MTPMRLAVVTQTRDRVGGVESYVEGVLPALARHHDVAFWSADAGETPHGEIRVRRPVTQLCGGHRDGGIMDALRAWKPELLFAHGLQDEALEAEMLGIAPLVLVVHTYHGTCISSAKTMSWPVVRQCERPFGAACLALYFPRRCGGLSPSTALRLYRSHSLRLSTLRRAAAVVTLSRHMRDEVVRNSVPRERVHVVPPFAGPLPHVDLSERRTGSECRLLYLGRLEPLKGVRRLLSALQTVVNRLDRPVRVVIAGDGTERAELEAYAISVARAQPRLTIEFVGWQDDEGRAGLLAESDALVVPSVWPEPFGLVGLEAAAAGVPAIAFAAGGIPEWLRDGENGCLAPARGARPELLADAIVRCVGIPEQRARLAAGARRAAANWSLERHMAALQDVFRDVVSRTAAV